MDDLNRPQEGEVQPTLDAKAASIGNESETSVDAASDSDALPTESVVPADVEVVEEQVSAAETSPSELLIEVESADGATCRLCGSSESFLVEMPGKQETWSCSDTAWCRRQRNA